MILGKKHRIFFVILVLFLAGCHGDLSSDTKDLTNPNPTSHVFKLPINKLTDTLLALFTEKEEFNNPDLKSVFTRDLQVEKRFIIKSQLIFRAESITNALFGKEYFSEINKQK